jgi:hypothetical protein
LPLRATIPPCRETAIFDRLILTMENDQLIILGQTNFRNQMRRFGIKKEDRRRHTYIIGKTGMGKSTVLLNMIVQDIQYGNGVAVFDPHGELVERVLDYIPARRINETIYFNPADTEYPIAFNPLHNPHNIPKHLVASGIVQVFKKIWIDSWGPRLEYILRNAILALLEQPGNTFLAVPRLLIDDIFRNKIIKQVKDPVVRNFWAIEYEQYPKVFKTETISPIQNKVGQFLSTAMMRNILGQTKTKFDLRKVMDSGKILLLNLAKGKIGEDNSSLLGSLMLSQLWLAAQTRANIPEEKRQDFYLYIDELQSFATDEFPTILAEARKYRLNIAGMANQFISQLPENLASAILGNVGTLISFCLGSEDAEIISRELFPVFTSEHLQNLPAYNSYLKLSIDGRTSEQFSAVTLPIQENKELLNVNKISEQTRQRYCTSKYHIERRINKWL